MALGVSLWLFLLVRSPHFPPINEGEPTNWAALDSVLNRTQYAKPPLSERQADFSAQLGDVVAVLQLAVGEGLVAAACSGRWRSCSAPWACSARGATGRPTGARRWR